MNKQQREILKDAIDTFGCNLQKIVAIEEMSELQKELTKDIRFKGSRNNITEEIADVLIMIEQLKMMFAIDDSEIEEFIDSKICRLEKTISEIKE